MIKNILELLKADDYLIGDPDVDIAKGINEAPTSFSEIAPFVKRNKYHLRNTANGK